MSYTFDPKRTNAAKMARRRFEAREVLDREKSRPCTDCGHSYQPCQIDVLSREGGRPVPIARMLHLSIARLLAEIRKCDLVCANCSRLRTWLKEREGRRGPT